MKSIEFTKPHLYLDMDGVQADFFTAWANIHNKNRYKEIGDKEQREKSIQELTDRGPEFVFNFFGNLPLLPNFHKLINFLKTNKINYTILSAPLRGNHEASILGKKHWLDKHHPNTSQSAIFTGMKEKYATTNGQPNVLVDDHKKYISRWEEKGGIGVLYRDDNIDLALNRLKEIYQPYLDK
jgi:5'(3')-deoxyribonucleotidase